MMFDQQQKTSNSLLKNPDFDFASLDEAPFSIEDVAVSIAEGSNNTNFPSKIS
uniref:Uncharacterized protein n=1 Tax=Rhizophora mucronata TaxID=61149 RepID=A0A2P2PEY9_RHIMU